MKYTYTCFCGKRYRGLSALKIHFKLSHFDKISTLHCPICQESFVSEIAIRRHCFLKALKDDDHAAWYYLAYKGKWKRTKTVKQVIERAAKKLREGSLCNLRFK